MPSDSEALPRQDSQAKTWISSPTPLDSENNLGLCKNLHGDAEVQEIHVKVKKVVKDVLIGCKLGRSTTNKEPHWSCCLLGLF